MINVLVVDDVGAKRRAIRDAIESELGSSPHRIDEADSAQGALAMIGRVRYALMVLDVVLPRSEGEAPEREGGLLVLRHLSLSPTGSLPEHIVGLTGYTDLMVKAQQEFGAAMWHVIEYDQASNRWQRLLRRYVRYVNDAAQRTAVAEYGHDLAIVTALQTPELSAVLDLDAGWRIEKSQGDETIYHSGRFSRGQKTLSVVTASACRVGMPAAAAFAMKVVEVCRPRYLAMCGIAAGYEGECGDLLIADQCWDYALGKVRTDSGASIEFAPAPQAIPLSEELHYKLSWFSARRDVLGSVADRWRGSRVSVAPRIQIGPMGSGPAVLQAKHLMAGIRKHNRKVVGIDMEAYGVFLAAQIARDPKPAAFVVKGLSDFGDERKSDDYQAYAAYISAEFVREFALECL